MEEKTKKELIWEDLKTLKRGERINMVQMSKKVDCSLAYISATIRYAFESGFLRFDETGNYIIKKIPNWPTFQEETNKKYSKYRSSTNRGAGRRKGKAVPKDFKFEVQEENIIKVISGLINELKETKEKLSKLMIYTKIIKEERDDLLAGFEEFD